MRSRAVDSLNSRVMEAILELGPGASAEYIALKANRGATSVYRSIADLTEKDIIRKSGGGYSLRRESAVVRKFSELVDAQRMESLGRDTQREVQRIAYELREQMGDSLVALVLFGSTVALGDVEPRDVDLLLVVDDSVEDTPRMKSLSLTTDTTMIKASTFRELWAEGIDVVRSAVSWGIAIDDPNGFIYNYRLLPREPITDKSINEAFVSLEGAWEVFYDRMKHSEWRVATTLKNKIATLLGRIALMELGIPPKTKWEISWQLERAGVSLGRDIERIYTYRDEDMRKHHRKIDTDINKLSDCVDLISEERAFWENAKKVIWGKAGDMEAGLRECLKEIGADCRVPVMETEGTIADLAVLLDNSEVNLLFLSSTKQISKRTIKLLADADLTLIYNEYQNIPPDDRGPGGNREIAEEAEKRDFKAIRSNVMFGMITDWLFSKKSAGEVMKLLSQGEETQEPMDVSAGDICNLNNGIKSHLEKR